MLKRWYMVYHFFLIFRCRTAENGNDYFHSIELSDLSRPYFIISSDDALSEEKDSR